MSNVFRKFKSASLILIAFTYCGLASAGPHNVILFVPDGLRSHMVNADNAPTMNDIARRGVFFANSHSMFPTFTMANASALSTGHLLGDTGVFSNTIFSNFVVNSAGKTVTPFLENDAVLGEMDQHFAGNFVDEESILKAARLAGLNTAAVGKVGPTLMFDHTERSGQLTVTIDDATGSAVGIPLASWVTASLAAQGMPSAAPGRGNNGPAGTATVRGTQVANVGQQQWFADVFTQVLLPKFKQDDKPFIAVFWSRDPDGSQHNQGDSLNQLIPGINGPTSLAGIHNADDNLAQIRTKLAELGLAETTDIVVAADHGFSTISKQSKTSFSATQSYKDVPTGFLPPGFVGIDLARALKLPLMDPNDQNALIGDNAHTKAGNALIGTSPETAEVVVAANGGSDLVYLPLSTPERTQKVIDTLLAQDYVSGLFVDDSLGKFAGTLPISALNFKGSAHTPMPSIVINFRAGSSGCADPLNCNVEVSDTTLQQGQGMHGNFARSDTLNFMAAIGPDFKQRFTDPAPASNADIGKKIASILGLKITAQGQLEGRVLSEARLRGKLVKFTRHTLSSVAATNGPKTEMRTQRVGTTVYLDTAGFVDRTPGLNEKFVQAW